MCVHIYLQAICVCNIDVYNIMLVNIYACICAAMYDY